jgi:hypothetical protein
VKILAGLLVGLTVFVSASPPAVAEIAQAGNCQVDTERIELPACAIEMRNGDPYITRGLLRVLFTQDTLGGRSDRVGTQKLAYGYLPKLGWFYFNRSGRVVVHNVSGFDNGPSPFFHGLVIVTRDQKFGLANTHGELVVPLEYDAILNFDQGRWAACKGCRSEQIGEHAVLSKGGDWFALDRHGNLIGPIKDPLR